MIYIKLDIVPPKATAQQKGAFVTPGGHVRFFKKKKVAQAEDFLATMLAPYKPEEPVKGPVAMRVRWVFPYRKSEKKAVVKAGKEIAHTTRPDLDNLEKSLLDVMTRLQFWEDDAQISTLLASKGWGPKGYLSVILYEGEELT